ncbi:hypothetical protein VTK73DRAFT_2540 [Phialemonium thermophilum]|uniref:CBM1 domain-containing protein n=1 Tax=Phialemonium thermophilum TaxID=223376 RepID=A0ABR3X414_9PEZI
MLQFAFHYQRVHKLGNFDLFFAEMALKFVLPVLVLAGVAIAQGGVQSQYGQCAGSNYAGPTACPGGSYCSYGNPWYSQCLPGTADIESDDPGYVPDAPIETSSFRTVVTIGQPDQPDPTIVTTYITFLTPSPQPTSVIVIGGVTYTLVPDVPETDVPGVQPRNVVTTPTLVARHPAVREPVPATADAPTPTTLQAGQYWIRAVEAPNFHKYLQTNPPNEPGTAILGSSRTAGQFNIASGQLVEATGADPLYLQVERPADLTNPPRTLATWFNTTKNDFGTFEFSGDALTWSHPDVKRQNLAAWLVCKDQALFINTGAYSYQTPAGCADETIHYYNGATAND